MISSIPRTCNNQLYYHSIKPKEGVEPTFLVYETSVLPLYYSGILNIYKIKLITFIKPIMKIEKITIAVVIAGTPNIIRSAHLPNM